MDVILPKEGQYKAVVGLLDNQFIEHMLANMVYQDIWLRIPKFRFESNFKLKELLRTMGMSDAVTPYVADFSGMDGTDKLFLAHVLHKAIISVDEKGTEASAATAAFIEAVSMPTTMNVDRPFIFLIRDVESGAILFIGRVLNPLA